MTTLTSTERLYIFLWTYDFQSRIFLSFAVDNSLDNNVDDEATFDLKVEEFSLLNTASKMRSL